METIKIRKQAECGYLTDCVDNGNQWVIWVLTLQVPSRLKLLYEGELVDILFVDIDQRSYDVAYHKHFRRGEYFTYDLVIDGREIVDVIPGLPWIKINEISKRWKHYVSTLEVEKKVHDIDDLMEFLS